MANEIPLYMADHPYYCNEGNFFSNGCGAEYKTWKGFLESEGNGDLDMNLVFRWDMQWTNDRGEQIEPTGDPNYRGGVLKVFFVGQRKGIFRYATVEVCAADEPAIRAWLTIRWNHLRSLWYPLEGSMPCPLAKAKP